MKIGLELNAAELKQTLLNGVLLGLAEACLGLGEQGGQAPAPAQIAVPTLIPAPAMAQPAAAQPIPTPAVQPVAPIPPVQAAPATAPVVAPAPAPVAAPPTYTLDQIAVAGAALMDANKMDQLLALLAKYGVNAITQLPPEQYGAFATELRALGAQI